MPTYEYACSSCGEHLEIVQSFRDDPLTTCPACGGGLRKVFGSIGVVFKGSGFYKTDSRPSKSAATASSTKDASSGSGTDSSAGSGGSGSSEKPASSAGSGGSGSSEKPTSSGSGSGSSGSGSGSTTSAAAS